MGGVIDTLSYLGTGTISAEDYNPINTGYNLMATTGGTANLDQFGRVQNLIWENYGTAQASDGYQYAYSLQGNVSQRVNAVDSVFSEWYQNDALDQLTSLKRGASSGSPDATEGFTPTGFGNWSSYQVQETVSGVLTTVLDQQRTAGATNKIATVSNTIGGLWAAPAYDATGNATQTPSPLNPADGVQIQVDGWNRVTHRRRRRRRFVPIRRPQ